MASLLGARLHDGLLCKRHCSLQPLQRLQRTGLHVIGDCWSRVGQKQEIELKAEYAPIVWTQQKLFQSLQTSHAAWVL